MGAPPAQFFTCVSKHQRLRGSWTHGPAPNPATWGVQPPGKLGTTPPRPPGVGLGCRFPPDPENLLPPSQSKGPAPVCGGSPLGDLICPEVDTVLTKR